ncbi:NADH dehydrogenase [ubiquinone] 1 alpha subcomplex assembly factor 2-like isoform X2 [Xenia sp. Carnegie-2017]|nr:NADH dehydrogenase [ubiquinone] 1 alpha subcomplex assembly factor 2-like isoform X2 [Xenia sp. Carnegie-2017]
MIQGGSGKKRREVVMKLKHEEYKAGVIPVEWEAWLRGSVDKPPSLEDLVKKQQQQIVLSKKVIELNRRDMKLQEEEYAAGLVAKPVGHASATTYGNVESSKGPRTSGGQFQPGVWGKQLDQQKKNDTGKYEPESWKPS